MQQKRNFYIALILLLLLILSIGYGVLSTNLNISGTAQMNSSSWDIHFDNLIANENSIEASTPASINDTKTTINFTVDLEKPGDFYEFNVDIVNAGTIDAMISEVLRTGLDSSLEKYITYTVKYTKGIELQEKDSLKAGASENIVVRVEFNKDVNEEDLPQTQQSISLSFEVEYIQEDGSSNEVIAPVLAATTMTDKTAFRSDTYKQNIKTITLEEEINIPDDAIESWDVGEAQNGNVMAYIVPNVEDSTMYDLYIQGDGALIANENSSYLFENFNNLQIIKNANILDMSNVYSASDMFANNWSLEELDVSNWNTSKITNMSQMFNNCEKIKQLDVSNWDVSSVTNMRLLFGGTQSLTEIDVDKWNTSNVTSMYGLFNASSVYKLDVKNWDVSNVTDMGGMFSLLYNVTELDLSTWNTSSLTDINYIFHGSNFIKLNVSNWDTSKVTNMSGAFNYFTLSTIDLSDWDISNVTDMNKMFFDDDNNDSRSVNIILNKTSFNKNVDLTDFFSDEKIEGMITPVDVTIIVHSEADKTLIDSLGYTNVTVTVG